MSELRWTLRLDGSDLPDKALIGGKAWSIARMRALALPVPPAFVVTTRACVEFLARGDWPDGLAEEIDAGMAWLEAATGRRFGHGPQPLLVSVRSGAPISMPGMMDTILNMGICAGTEEALVAEMGDAGFAHDVHRRFYDLYADIVLKCVGAEFPAEGDAESWAATLKEKSGQAIPGTPRERLFASIDAVFNSWNGRRARRYRKHHGIPDDLGTAVAVQAMVFGNMDAQSGTGVLFSRNPITGERKPYGEYLARAQGEDVVSGKFTPQPVETMRQTVPQAFDALMAASERLEEANGDVQDIEFTVQKGELFLLQSRAAKRAPAAAVRIATEMVREGVITPQVALTRVTPDQVRLLLAPRLKPGEAEAAETLCRGEAASPGIGIGTVVTDSDEAERRAAQGEDVILARVTTSPEDLHGMLAARAVITERGGATSHAAVVSRALGIACVVGCGEGSVTAHAGQTVTVDGSTGRIYAGALAAEAPDENAETDLAQLKDWAQATCPIPVHTPDAAPAAQIVDLNTIEGGEDAANLPNLLRDAEAATGGALATEEGMSAALSAGLKFVIGKPALPLLLAGARAGMAHEDRETVAVSAQG
ncbi:MAG: pyruvate, phosphate dikinase [Rhodosalinus sp.]